MRKIYVMRDFLTSHNPPRIGICFSERCEREGENE